MRLRGSRPGNLDRNSQSLFDACVDLQPHQIEAGLFALKSPLSKGVILADEVGLGKTIEAGLVLCQFWAERKRHLLVICPASIRKQWQQELTLKFNLPSMVLDSREYRWAPEEGSRSTLHPSQDRDCLVPLCKPNEGPGGADSLGLGGPR